MTYVDGDRYAGFAPARTLLRRSRSITSIPASRPRWPTCKRAAATCPASATPIWSNTDLALNYSFNANMSTYVEYKLNLLQRQNAVGTGADDIVETGIMYQF